MNASSTVLDHSLPQVLADAQRLAAAGEVDTTGLDDGPLLFDVGDMAVLRVTGRDRQRFLHAMLSNDVAQLEPGQGRWATFNTVKGRTLCDVRLLLVDDDRKEGSLLALLEPGADQIFVDQLNPFIIAEKVYFEPAPEGHGWLLAGAGADGVLQQAGASCPSSTLFDHVETELGGCKVRVVRFDRTGSTSGDLLLLMSPEDQEAILQALGSIQRGDRNCLEAARVENGQPRFGIDLTEGNIPLEAGLKDRAIDFNKGCYIGQEVICRIDSMGTPARRLVRLRVHDSGVPAPGTRLFREQKEVGYVTSSVHSLRAGGPIALGYVKKKNNEPATTVLVGDPESQREATIEAHA